MVFQVEENLTPRGDKVANDLWSFGREKLFSDLVGKSGISHCRHDFLRGGSAGHIQGDNQSLAGIAHPLAV